MKRSRGSFKRYAWKLVVLWQPTKCYASIEHQEGKKQKNPSVYNGTISGPILESKGMRAIFQKKGKKMLRAKKGKIFENFDKNVQNLKIFWKRAGDCVYNIQYTYTISW